MYTYTSEVAVSIGTHSIKVAYSTSQSSSWNPNNAVFDTFTYDFSAGKVYTINTKSGNLGSVSNMTIDKEK